MSQHRSNAHALAAACSADKFPGAASSFTLSRSIRHGKEENPVQKTITLSADILTIKITG